jgi:outer membrane biogenesis lipoprotein LolB
MKNNFRILRRTFLAGALGLPFILSGCSAVEELPAGNARTQQWKGRFSLKVVSYQKTDRNSGSFVFTRSDEAAELTLFGPLGVVLAKIEETEREALLSRPNEPVMQAKNSEELMKAVLGFPVPLPALTYWAQGEPIAGIPFVWTAPGREFEQNGWVVRLTRNELGKVSKLDIKNTGADEANEINLILVISNPK